MKKLLSLFLSTLLILTTISIVSVNAAITDNIPADATKYVVQDFEGLSFLKDDTYTYGAFHATNAVTGNDLPWVITSDSGTGTGYTVGPAAADTVNTSGYINGFGKSRTQYLKLTLADAVTVSDGLLYVNFRAKKYSGDYLTFSARSSDNKDIFALYYGNSVTTPTLKYNGTASATCSQTFSDWAYYGAVINFNKDTFELYTGSTLESVSSGTKTPFNSSIATYAFKDVNANDFGCIEISFKSGLCVDDLQVYSISLPSRPAISNASISGKVNLGETVTAGYTTYEHPYAVAEGNSYCYWEYADSASESGYTKIGENLPIKANQSVNYVLTEADRGRQLRLTVIPIDANGSEGLPLYTSLLPPIDSFTVTNLTSSGPTKVGGLLDPKVSSHSAKVDYINSTSSDKTFTIVSAWYNKTTGELDSVNIDVVNVPSGIAEANGATIGTFVSSQAKSFATADETRIWKMRLFVFDSFNNIVPLTESVTYLGQDLKL